MANPTAFELAQEVHSVGAQAKVTPTAPRSDSATQNEQTKVEAMPLGSEMVPVMPSGAATAMATPSGTATDSATPQDQVWGMAKLPEAAAELVKRQDDPKPFI